MHWRTPIVSGVLDEHTRDVFTRGQCHSAAAALAEQEGWGDVAVLVEREYFEYISNGFHEDTILHCCAIAPSGAWVDVRGQHRPEDEIKAWQGTLSSRRYAKKPPEILNLTTDAAGARALATRAGCEALGINTETPLLPTSMPLARSIRTAVLANIDNSDSPGARTPTMGP